MHDRESEQHRDLRCAHLHFDCVSGIAGDMTLGAMIDLGVPEDVIREALDAVGMGGDRLRVQRVLKHGIQAIDVKVRVHDHEPHEHTHEPHEHAHEHHAHEHEHNHDHAHEHEHDHAHTHYRDIARRIREAELAPGVAERALDMFERVARAEAKMHGSTIEDVAFHEVGAVDSIVDIVGSAAALAWLEPVSVSCARVSVGTGQVRCAHGIMPVPAPATVEILREVGGVMHAGGVTRELCTPTGAAILASAVTDWAPMPPLVPVATGYGAGDMDLPDRANVLRVTVGRPAGSSEPRSSTDATTLWQLEANIDDMSPELCEHAAARAFAAGAVDVWWTPVLMKKTRPALLLSALMPEPARSAVEDAILAETTTLGVRSWPVQRSVLERRIEHVDTPYGRLPVKVGERDARVLNAAPEYEPCRQAATEHGVPLKEVYAGVMAAWHARRPA